VAVLRDVALRAAPQDEAVCRRCIQQHNEDLMENETTADLGGQTDIVERSAGGEGALSVRAAANSLVDTRREDVASTDDEDKENSKSLIQQPPGEARDRA
jgi:hypothetical protein